jgi:hypothetical protein
MRSLIAFCLVLFSAIGLSDPHPMYDLDNRHLVPGTVDPDIPEETVISNISPTLIGGTVVDPKDWPASPWVSNCSSTLIGPRVLLTAAHCVSNGGTKSFTIAGTRYTSSCEHHPSYRNNSTADWALCLVSTPVIGIKFENVAKPSDHACRVGKTYTWTGYGCLRWGGPIDGRFRVGNANAIRCPSGTNYDTVTRGSVALCSGDSGGGGYETLPDGRRFVVGANSRSNTTDTSYVSSTYTTAYYNWSIDWAGRKNVKFCGIHEGVENCRDAEQDPGPDPDPAPDCKAEMDAVSETLSSHNSAVAGLKACLDR